ncbi:dirigent protein 10-like [Benincasa hispida]|uniref:dirigent protein 10-like n=1 Tax=Benincasa hispida TaxID=102211 RepID=UPI001900823F|nr:dirigent protein 10-like [Benincasa hispida]
MTKLHFHSLLMKTIACFLSFTTIINLSSSARIFENPTRNHHYRHHKLSFLMRDVLNSTTHHYSSSKSPTNKATTSGQLPFSKPLGFFPPNGGIPIPETYTTTGSFSSQTPDISSIGISFPARTTLQELDYGMVKGIDEELFGTSRHKSRVVVGRIEGFYVENSEDSGGHMMATTMYFGKGEVKDGLRLFGVYRSDHVKESHVAIIGGLGKYLGANGYATLKKSFRTKFGANHNNFIEFNVYLSK